MVRAPSHWQSRSLQIITPANVEETVLWKLSPLQRTPDNLPNYRWGMCSGLGSQSREISSFFFLLPKFISIFRNFLWVSHESHISKEKMREGRLGERRILSGKSHRHVLPLSLVCQGQRLAPRGSVASREHEISPCSPLGIWPDCSLSPPNLPHLLLAL